MSPTLSRVYVVGASTLILACGDAADDARVADTSELVAPCGDPASACRRAPMAICNADLSAAIVSAEQGSCQVDADTGAGACTFPEPEEVACEPTRGVCLGGECVEVERLCDWPFGESISFVRTLALGHQASNDPATGVPEDACCEDFDDDGVLDNKLGVTFRELRGLLVDINPFFVDQIATGRLNLLWDIRDLDSLDDDPWVQIVVYEAFFEPEGPPHRDGHGLFRVKERAWLPGTRTPRLHAHGRIEDGVLRMDEGVWSFFFAPPDGKDAIELPFHSFRFEGQVSMGPNGKGLAITGVDGGLATLSGLIDKRDFWRTLNNEVALSCDCAVYAAGVEGPIDPTTGVCHEPVQNTCTPGENAICDYLNRRDLCEFAVSSFASDIDTDGDDEGDMISAGLFLELTSGAVSAPDFPCER